jgi:hypothetical protein
MISVKRTMRKVWKGGKRSRLTRRAAYLDAAWEAWRAKNWPEPDGCGCEDETNYSCPYHRFNEEGPTRESVALTDHRRKVIDRLARWLMWRDGKAGKE